MIGPKRIDTAIDEASKAFWVEIAKQFPEFQENVLDTGSVVVLQWQMRDAVIRYVQMNLEASERKPNESVGDNNRTAKTHPKTWRS